MNMNTIRIAALLSAALLSAGCVETRPAPPYPPPRPVPAPPPPVQEPAPPSPDVYFYPKQGQTQPQQDRDRYECYLWANKKTGYDPSRLQPDTRARVRVVAVPGPGHDAAVGTVTGAVVGAAVSRPRDAGAGALIGAVAGAVLGSASDESRRRAASEEQARLDEMQSRRAAASDAQIQSYRRALKACLEGRGYSVD